MQQKSRRAVIEKDTLKKLGDYSDAVKSNYIYICWRRRTSHDKDETYERARKQTMYQNRIANLRKKGPHNMTSG